jgi:hypothetical protein
VRLTIARDGAVLSQSLSDLCEGCDGAVPFGALGMGDPRDTTSLTLRDLTGDGDPEVLVDLYTGGAHCCTVMALFGWDAATSSYRRLVRNWLDPSYRVADLTGGPGAELLSYDASFAYAFCAYACSLMPEQIFRYDGSRLVNVTRDFPARIERDVRQIRNEVRRVRRKPDQRYALKGFLPALCADLYLLNRGAECRSELSTALRRGELANEPLDIVAGGRKYMRQVLRFLQRAGYR